MTMVLAPEGQRFPQMRRVDNGHRHPRRCHRGPLRPRRIPEHRMARVWWHRVVDTHGPTGAAAAVLAVVADCAGDLLRDVDITEPQIGARLLSRHPEASPWGTGTRTVRRALRQLEATGWLSYTYVAIPSAPGLMMLRIRLHVAPHAQDAFGQVVSNSDAMRRRRAAEAAAERKAAAAAARAEAAADAAQPAHTTSDQGDALADKQDVISEAEAEAARWAQDAIRRDGLDLAAVLTVLATKYGRDSSAYESGARLARWAEDRRRARVAREAEARLTEQQRGARDGP